MDDIKTRILQLENELIALRRDFHMYPELGFKEFKTADKIEAFLTKLGLTVSRTAKTGVTALLKGDKPGPVLMLRADMDALPLEEQNKVDYKSKNKRVMHACGHDAHMAMLLVAAKVLKEKEKSISGTIKFLFQPNEEIAGALPMINEGVL
ncbi:MAG: amidohydrolase, partial [Thermodesulfobacteriota bacterium]|nr:amidohydrolase [Thermodesulfobacteriota bacterium]